VATFPTVRNLIERMKQVIRLLRQHLHHVNHEKPPGLCFFVVHAPMD